MAATIVGPRCNAARLFRVCYIAAAKIRGRCEKQMAETSEQQPITIKKYANRRLYNTDTSSYVTLDNLAKMVKDGVDFVVVDAKTGQDITRSVLTQIIFEEEAKGPNLLPIGFLRQLIALYGDSLQGLVPNYLDYTMRAFAENQDHMRRTMSEAVGGMFPFTQWEDIGRQNMAMFDQAVQLWSPFAKDAGDGKPSAQAAAPGDVEAGTLDALRHQLDALQRQVEALTRGKKD